MAFIRDEVIAAATSELLKKSANADQLLFENRSRVTASHNRNKTYDDFLCHSHADKKLVVGMKGLLEGAGRSVFVDWIASPNPPGAAITAANASLVRSSMNRCKRLVYLHTKKSTVSKWCPWELGYFDALGKDGIRVALIASTRSATVGQEYLDLYPQLNRSNLHS